MWFCTGTPEIEDGVVAFPEEEETTGQDRVDEKCSEEGRVGRGVSTSHSPNETCPSSGCTTLTTSARPRLLVDLGLRSRPVQECLAFPKDGWEKGTSMELGPCGPSNS